MTLGALGTPGALGARAAPGPSRHRTRRRRRSRFRPRPPSSAPGTSGVRLIRPLDWTARA
jgi:hypothetical protein